MSFDRAKWDTGKGIYAENNPRLSIVDGAISKGVKAGTTRATVIRIIGNPDEVGVNTATWFLGLNGMVPDPLTLVVTFDANDIVIKTKIERI